MARSSLPASSSGQRRPNSLWAQTDEISVRHLPRALLAASASSALVTVRSVSHFETTAPLATTRPVSMSRRVYVTLPLTRVLSATSRPGRSSGLHRHGVLPPVEELPSWHPFN